MGRDNAASDTKGIQIYDGILTCKISIIISWKALADAASFFTNCSLEITEASFIGRFKTFSDDKIEIFICKFESPELVGRPPLEPSEIDVPFFLFRGSQTSILSVDTFLRRVKELWNGISYQNSPPFCFSDFIFVWATARFNSTIGNKLEVACITFNAIAPNISIKLQKIRNYSFDCDCFRHCIQTNTADSKFQHFKRLRFDGTSQDFRFGFFLMDPSGCLVPYLDGERVIQATPPAGVWCTGAVNEKLGTTTPLTFYTWLSLLRYAFSPSGRRAFCTSPVLAVHNAASNSVSFYSIQSDSVKSSRYPYIELPLPASEPIGYTYAEKLHFHMFTGFEDLKSRSSRVSSQRLVIHLSSLSHTHLPDESAAMNYSKLLQGVDRLASELGSQVVRGPPAGEVASEGRKFSTPQFRQNNKPVKRSVKFHLPPSKDVASHLSRSPDMVAGFEVPEASMLLEEGVVTYSPYRYFASPPLPSPPSQPLQCHHPPSCCHLQVNRSNSSAPAAHEEISRLEALVERLLAEQLNRRPISKKADKTTIGTNTPMAHEFCSAAVNTSGVWPTPEDIGLISPTQISPSLPLTLPGKTVESVGIQCDCVWNSLPQPQDDYSFREFTDQSIDFPLSPSRSPLFTNQNFQQSPESVLSLDAGFPIKPAGSSVNRPLHQEQPCKENNIGDPGYSRLLAGIQQVLESTPHMRKTTSVPSKLSLMGADLSGVPGCLSAASTVTVGKLTSLADAEADEARYRRRCEEEVAARLDFSHSFQVHRSEMPLRGPLEKKKTPQPNRLETSYPTTQNSYTSFLSDQSSPSPPPQQRHKLRSLRSTDESAVLMGLARKYLPSSVIAQLAPLVSSGSVRTPEASSCCGTDFSLATQRYLTKHGLLPSGGCESTPVGGSRWRRGGGLNSTEEFSDIPRLMVMDGSQMIGSKDSYLQSSRIFSSAIDGGQEVEDEKEEDNFDAPILDLERLRALPKLL